jgi:hypothetical protein
VRGVIEALERGAKVEAAARPSRDDPGGATLAGLKAFRRQRLEALRAELARLEGRAAAAAEEAASGGGGEGGEAAEADGGGEDAAAGEL